MFLSEATMEIMRMRNESNLVSELDEPEASVEPVGSFDDVLLMIDYEEVA